MAIVYNLPMTQWYSDETSKWTLDYPPLFALFEFLLAVAAKLIGFDKDLELTSEAIRSQSIILYQKSTVIVSDLVYFYAVYKLCHAIDARILRQSDLKSNKDTNSQPKPLQSLIDALYQPNASSCIALFMILNPCLLLIDHIHFQYNGLLSGILFLSVSYVIEGKYALASFWFAVLLNMKHIYLYSAPAFGLYFLTSHCLSKPSNGCGFFKRITSFVVRTLKLGSIVISILLITFTPFVHDIESLKQITTRLFPFKRGLTHAYWAPNFWCLYNVMDKVLMKLLKPPPIARFDMDSISGTRLSSPSSTSGLVQEYGHEYLPSIKPITTFAIVGLFTLPIIIKYLININRKSSIFFLKTLVVTSMTSYMFGWHVHEKAILLSLLPLIPVALIDTRLYPALVRLNLFGIYSILPLLFEDREYLIKMTIFIAYYKFIDSNKPKRVISKRDLEIELAKMSRFRIIILALYDLIDLVLLIGLITNELYVSFVFGRFNYPWNPLAKLNTYAFLPLLMTSSLSAIGISLTYIELYCNIITTPFGATN